MHRTTRNFLLALPIAISAGLYAGHVTVPPIVHEVDPPSTFLDTYEDGSGVLYDADDNEIATYPEGTFPWDCRTMGNRICGPTD